MRKLMIYWRRATGREKWARGREFDRGREEGRIRTDWFNSLYLEELPLIPDPRSRIQTTQRPLSICEEAQEPQWKGATFRLLLIPSSEHLTLFRKVRCIRNWQKVAEESQNLESPAHSCPPCKAVPLAPWHWDTHITTYIQWACSKKTRNNLAPTSHSINFSEVFH